jgi:hypothetical protein
MGEPSSPQRALVVAALAVAWPAFLGAAVLEALVFALVDPADLSWWGGATIDWPRQAVYTAAFFVFWLVVGAAGALSVLLSRPGCRN